MLHGTFCRSSRLEDDAEQGRGLERENDYDDGGDEDEDDEYEVSKMNWSSPSRAARILGGGGLTLGKGPTRTSDLGAYPFPSYLNP